MPDLPPPDMSDPLGGALRWANAGWYVGPIAAGKHPGSVLSTGWPAKTTRDAEVIALYFAGRDYQPFVHCGRSGAVAFDLDHPEQAPDVLRRAILECRPPMQTTRAVEGMTDAEVLASCERFERRMHVLFAVPPGRMFGNGTGGLGKGWGDVRGRNGVVVVDPARHHKEAEGGEYRVRRAGPLPELPQYVAELLPDAGESAGMATDSEVAEVLHFWRGAARPEALRAVLGRWDRDVRGLGASRHDTLVTVACWAAREARARVYPLADALAALWERWVADTAVSLGSGRVLPASEARSEFGGAVSWAVAQAKAATQARIDEIAAKHREVDLLWTSPLDVDPAGSWDSLC